MTITVCYRTCWACAYGHCDQCDGSAVDSEDIDYHNEELAFLDWCHRMGPIPIEMPPARLRLTGIRKRSVRERVANQPHQQGRPVSIHYRYERPVYVDWRPGGGDMGISAGRVGPGPKPAYTCGCSCRRAS